MPQWVIEQWFIGVYELDLMGKGIGVKPEPRAASSTISLQHNAALQAVFSIATGWIWPNKRETERKFHPIPADKRVLFQQLMSFLLEKCENLDWLKETRNLFLPTLFFLCIWGPFSVPVYKDKPGWQNESWRLIKNSWWGFRQLVYVHGELRGMIPCWCGLADRQCKVLFFLLLLLIVQRQQIYVIAYSLSS